MSVLTGKQAAGLVEGMIDPETQTQMCGIELTVESIKEFYSPGEIGFHNKDRVLPETHSAHGGEGWSDVWLDQGAYLVTFNEVVTIPKDVMAIARPRSSLLRCGVTVETAMWDPGYKGRSQCLLVVHNPEGFILYKNARILQLIFMKLDKEAEKLYNGVYQGENL